MQQESNPNPDEQLKIMNPELFKVPDYLKNSLRKYIEIKEQIIQTKMQINQALADENQIEKISLQETHNLLKQEHEQQKEEFAKQFKIFIQNFKQQLQMENPKKLIRISNFFLENQVDIIEEMLTYLDGQELKIENNANDGIIIYSEQVKPENFLFKVRNPNYVRVNKRQNLGSINMNGEQQHQNEQLVEQIFEEAKNLSVSSFEPDWVQNLEILEVGQTSISFNFKAPDNNGAPIDKYQIYIIDTTVEPMKFLAFMKSIVGGEDQYIVQIKFDRIKNIDTTNMILPFDQNLQICIRAHNKHGWSLERNPVIFPLFMQYYDKTTLYMKGNLSTIRFDIIFQDDISINSSQDSSAVTLCQIQLIKVEVEEENVRSVSLNHSGLLVNSNSEVAQWGQTLSFLNGNDTGKEILQSDFVNSEIYRVAVKVPVKIVEAGTNFSFCVSVTGQVYGWGANDMGQLGIGSLTSHVYPQLLTFFDDNKIFINDVKCGQEAAIAKSNDGKVYAWGKRQLLIPNTTGLIEIKDSFGSIVNYACSYDDDDFVSINPREIKGVQALSITAGYAHYGILSKTGQIFIWGENSSLVFGFKEAYNRPINNLLLPVLLDLKLEQGESVAEISFGSYHSLARIHHKDYDYVLSWGSNVTGQCGQNLTNTICSIGKVQGIPNEQRIISISAGFDHNLFLTNLNELYGCGSNMEYQLTDKDIQFYRKAIKLVGLPNIKKIIAGFKVTALLVL